MRKYASGSFLQNGLKGLKTHFSSAGRGHIGLAGLVASADEVGGKYCEDCQIGELIPPDSQLSAISRGMRGYALDPENAKAFRRKSEKMVGETFA